MEQPADSDKIVVDNVTDVAATFEEVLNHPSPPHLALFMHKINLPLALGSWAYCRHGLSCN